MEQSHKFFELLAFNLKINKLQKTVNHKTQSPPEQAPV